MKTLEEALKELCDNCELNESKDCPYQNDFPNDCSKRTLVVIEYTNLNPHSHPMVYGRSL